MLIFPPFKFQTDAKIFWLNRGTIKETHSLIYDLKRDVF